MAQFLIKSSTVTNLLKGNDMMYDLLDKQKKSVFENRNYLLTQRQQYDKLDESYETMQQKFEDLQKMQKYCEELRGKIEEIMTICATAEDNCKQLIESGKPIEFDSFNFTNVKSSTANASYNSDEEEYEAVMEQSDVKSDVKRREQFIKSYYNYLLSQGIAPDRLPDLETMLNNKDISIEDAKRLLDNLAKAYSVDPIFESSQLDEQTKRNLTGLLGVPGVLGVFGVTDAVMSKTYDYWGMNIKDIPEVLKNKFGKSSGETSAQSVLSGLNTSNTVDELYFKAPEMRTPLENAALDYYENTLAYKAPETWTQADIDIFNLQNLNSPDKADLLGNVTSTVSESQAVGVFNPNMRADYGLKINNNVEDLAFNDARSLTESQKAAINYYKRELAEKPYGAWTAEERAIYNLENLDNIDILDSYKPGAPGWEVKAQATSSAADYGLKINNNVEDLAFNDARGLTDSQKAAINYYKRELAEKPYGAWTAEEKAIYNLENLDNIDILDAYKYDTSSSSMNVNYADDIAKSVKTDSTSASVGNQSLKLSNNVEDLAFKAPEKLSQSERAAMEYYEDNLVFKPRDEWTAEERSIYNLENLDNIDALKDYSTPQYNTNTSAKEFVSQQARDTNWQFVGNAVAFGLTEGIDLASTTSKYNAGVADGSISAGAAIGGASMEASVSSVKNMGEIAAVNIVSAEVGSAVGSGLVGGIAGGAAAIAIDSTLNGSAVAFAEQELGPNSGINSFKDAVGATAVAAIDNAAIHDADIDMNNQLYQDALIRQEAGLQQNPNANYNSHVSTPSFAENLLENAKPQQFVHNVATTASGAANYFVGGVQGVGQAAVNGVHTVADVSTQNAIAEATSNYADASLKETLLYRESQGLSNEDYFRILGISSIDEL